MIKIKVDGSVVSVQETEALYSGSADTQTCRFAFDTSWDNFGKSAVFRVGARAITAVIDDEDSCVLPWELLTRANIGLAVEVGVYGVSAEAEVMTSVWDRLGTVRDGTELGNDAREPSAGVYEQLSASVKKIDSKVVNYNEQAQTQVQRAESAASISQAAASEAAQSAAAARDAESALDAELAGIKSALDNLPAGSTLIVNDLSTGGTAAALSAEMGRLLAQRPSPNLLHNWYFANCVNQRGQGTYAEAGYTIDGWKKSAAGIVTIASDYVLLEAGDTFQHPLEADVIAAIRGVPVTFSLLTDSGLVYGTATYDGAAKVYYGSQHTAVQLQISGRGHPYIRANQAVNIIAAKLELGTTQTLAHQDANGIWVLNEIPDFAEELRKCQRYFQVINSLSTVDAHLLDVRGKDATTAVGTLALAVPMREIPAIRVSGNMPKVTLRWEEDGVEFMGFTTIAGVAASADTSDLGRLRIEVKLSEDEDHGFEEGKWYDILANLKVNIGQTTKLFLEADL